MINLMKKPDEFVFTLFQMLSQTSEFMIINRKETKNLDEPKPSRNRPDNKPR